MDDTDGEVSAPPEVTRAISMQIDAEWLFWTPGEKHSVEPLWSIENKERRAKVIRRWSETLEDPILRAGYRYILDMVDDSHRRRREGEEHEARARAVQLPALPADV
jgi:hypothetical protein